jgi:hypothetical protein
MMMMIKSMIISHYLIDQLPTVAANLLQHQPVAAVLNINFEVS